MKLRNRIPQLAQAVDAAIASRQLPPQATGWRTVVLLEEMAGVIGVPRTALRNMYYSDTSRLAAELSNYVLSNTAMLLTRIKNHSGKSREPIVWKRSLSEVKSSFENLASAIVVAETGDSTLRRDSDPAPALRREVGNLAVEIMAAALSFYGGIERWRLLQRAEKVFLNAMSPLSFQVETNPVDAALFSRFWENRATVCAMEWSTIWDDPGISEPVARAVVKLATIELQTAVEWEKKSSSSDCGSKQGSRSSHERLAQLTGDKANWLIKIGKFDDAACVLHKVAVELDKPVVEGRLLHVCCMRNIHDRKFLEAAQLAGAVAELAEDRSGHGSHWHISALMLEHHIALLRGETPRVPSLVEEFLRESPVAVSDIVDLNRYKKRLAAMEYSVITARNISHSIN
jgi:hypothetical protein